MTPKIHVYSAPADKFFVNSFLIELATGVIVVDTQFLVSAAQELGAKLDALGKPLAAIIITHPHPDHYNGLPVPMHGRGPVPVYANKATVDGISATQADQAAHRQSIAATDQAARAVVEDGRGCGKVLPWLHFWLTEHSGVFAHGSYSRFAT